MRAKGKILLDNTLLAITDDAHEAHMTAMTQQHVLCRCRT